MASLIDTHRTAHNTQRVRAYKLIKTSNATNRWNNQKILYMMDCSFKHEMYSRHIYIWIPISTNHTQRFSMKFKHKLLLLNTATIHLEPKRATSFRWNVNHQPSMVSAWKLCFFCMSVWVCKIQHSAHVDYGNHSGHWCALADCRLGGWSNKQIAFDTLKFVESPSVGTLWTGACKYILDAGWCAMNTGHLFSFMIFSFMINFFMVK